MNAIDRHHRSDRWDDEQDEDWRTSGTGRTTRPLTREEAQALRAAEPPVSPWFVTAAQAALGAVVALVAWWVTGRASVGWSAAYGAAVVVVPGALMARGMTSRLSSMSPAAGAVGFMFWEMVKIAVSVAMLVMAPRIVEQLSWPALLVALVLCIKMYWVALLWRRRSKN